MTALLINWHNGKACIKTNEIDIFNRMFMSDRDQRKIVWNQRISTPTPTPFIEILQGRRLESDFPENIYSTSHGNSPGQRG